MDFLSDEFPRDNRKMGVTNPKIPKWARAETLSGTETNKAKFEDSQNVSAVTLTKSESKNGYVATKTDYVDLEKKEMTPLGQTVFKKAEPQGKTNSEVSADATVPVHPDAPNPFLQQVELKLQDQGEKALSSDKKTAVETDELSQVETVLFSGEDVNGESLETQEGAVDSNKNFEDVTQEFLTSPYSEEDFEPGAELTATNIDYSRSSAGFVKRSYRRYPREVPIEIECDGQLFTTVSIDISLGGIYLRDPLPRWVSGYSKVRLRNEKTRQVVELTCYIVENQKPQQRHRVALLPLKDPQDEAHFEDWIKAAS